MQVLISIIIPTYNRSHLIGETLDSVIAQTYNDWECIVIDDGSTDYTDELMEFYCKKDSRIHYHHRPAYKPKGANACRNFGFELSRGKYIHWFDSDDLMAQDNLKHKIEYLIAHEECDFCICKVIKFEGEFKKENFTLHKEELKVTNNLYEEYITGKIIIFNVNPLWRRSVFNPKELYNENISQLQDLDFFSRVIYKTDSVGIINENLIYVRRNNESITTNKGEFVLHFESFFKVKERILGRTPENPMILIYTIKDLLWAMRWKMAVRDYPEAYQCFVLCWEYKNFLPTNLQIKLCRVGFFFQVFKTIKMGDTKFKKMLKI